MNPASGRPNPLKQVQGWRRLNLLQQVSSYQAVNSFMALLRPRHHRDLRRGQPVQLIHQLIHLPVGQLDPPLVRGSLKFAQIPY